MLLFFALAVLSKESAITLPGVVLLLDSSDADFGVRDIGSYLRRRWPLYVGLVLVAGGVLFARYLVLGSVASAYPPFGAQILEEVPRIYTVTASWPHIFRLMFFPNDLVSDYGPAVIPVFFGWNLENMLGVGLVLGTLFFSISAWRKGLMTPDRLSGRTVGWGVVWFVITLSPTSNVLFLSGILLAERTLYLPSVGFVAAAAWLLMALYRERPALAKGIMVAALCLLAAQELDPDPGLENQPGRVPHTRRRAPGVGASPVGPGGHLLLPGAKLRCFPGIQRCHRHFRSHYEFSWIWGTPCSSWDIFKRRKCSSPSPGRIVRNGRWHRGFSLPSMTSWVATPRLRKLPGPASGADSARARHSTCSPGLWKPREGWKRPEMPEWGRSSMGKGAIGSSGVGWRNWSWPWGTRAPPGPPWTQLGSGRPPPGNTAKLTVFWWNWGSEKLATNPQKVQEICRIQEPGPHRVGLQAHSRM